MGNGLLILAIILLLLLGPVIFLNVFVGALKIVLIVILVIFILGLFVGHSRGRRRM